MYGAEPRSSTLFRYLKGCPAASKDGPFGLLETGRRLVSLIALGDANRGAFLALQSAVSTRRRLVATDPPERRAFSCSWGGFGDMRVP